AVQQVEVHEPDGGLTRDEGLEVRAIEIRASDDAALREVELAGGNVERNSATPERAQIEELRSIQPAAPYPHVFRPVDIAVDEVESEPAGDVGSTDDGHRLRSVELRTPDLAGLGPVDLATCDVDRDPPGSRALIDDLGVGAGEVGTVDPTGSDARVRPVDLAGVRGQGHRSEESCGEQKPRCTPMIHVAAPRDPVPGVYHFKSLSGPASCSASAIRT